MIQDTLRNTQTYNIQNTRIKRTTSGMGGGSRLTTASYHSFKHTHALENTPKATEQRTYTLSITNTHTTYITRIKRTTSGMGGGGAPGLGPGGGAGSSFAAPKAGKKDLEGFLPPASGVVDAALLLLPPPKPNRPPLLAFSFCEEA